MTAIGTDKGVFSFWTTELEALDNEIKGFE